ncbi:hypothetical protein LLE87_29460 [Paenibacillus polymyxa]|nr:hypothetical protein [Paenibacillus polymyxa]
MEIAVGAHAQRDVVAGLRNAREPSAAQPQHAVRAAHLAHQQFNGAVSGQ